MASDQDTDPTVFQTERDAAATVQHITDSPAGSWRDGCYRLLEDTCRAAGVDLGKFDEQVLLELAEEEPTTVAVIVSLLQRARQGTPRRPRPQYGDVGPGVAMPGGGWISGPSI